MFARWVRVRAGVRFGRGSICQVLAPYFTGVPYLQGIPTPLGPYRRTIQGCLAHKKQRPPRTLPWDYA